MRKSGVTASGIYSVDPDGKGSMNVDWPSYKQGFGTLTGNLWLGNDNIHQLTASGNTVLRVELEDWDGNTAYAVYSTFKVDGESNKYRLTVGAYSGTAGNSLLYHCELFFTTKDGDNDQWGNNCAQYYRGAWWYTYCGRSNLNGQYLGDIVNVKGMHWYLWKNNKLSLKRSVMMVRPFSFTP